VATRREVGFAAAAFNRFDCLAVVLLLSAQLPSYPLLRAVARYPSYLPGDARTHALAARQLYEHGLRSGWIDSYVGGFPLAVHYPMLGWLLIGLPMKLGLEPAMATRLVCTLAVYACPVLLYLIFRANRTAVATALAASLLLTWVRPLNPFVGGLEAFYVFGLVSQVLVMPLVILWASAVFGARGKNASSRACMWANLSMLVHPQVAVCACLLMGLCAVVTAARTCVVRFCVSAGSAAFVAAFVYGSAVRNLSLPFGWPVLPSWMHLGFGPERLGDWLLDGELLDRGRAPVVTWLWALSVVLLAVKWRHPAARGAVAASAGSVFLCTIGPGLEAAGRLGELILSVFQPLRAMALVPVVASVTLLVALELRHLVWREIGDLLLPHIPHLSGYFRRFWPRHAALWGRLTFSLCLLLGSYVLISSRYRWFRSMATAFEVVSPQYPCGKNGPSRDEISALERALGSLRDGRLWFQDGDADLTTFCAVTTHFEAASAVPISPTAAVGAHVGFASVANHRLDIKQPGLSGRAELLGIRHVLVAEELQPDVAKGFELVGRYGPLRLYSRSGGSSLIGVGCVRERWSGSSAQLWRALVEQMDQSGAGIDWFARRTVEISQGREGLRKVELTDGCSSADAKILDGNSGPAQKSAIIATSTPVDVFLRVTAYPSWTLRVDGVAVAPRMVFPGYYSVRLQAGTHQFEARTEWSPVVLGALLVAVLGPMVLLAGSRLRAVKADREPRRD
jgi:hypothetical protein